jgi:hypothetical protein
LRGAERGAESSPNRAAAIDEADDDRDDREREQQRMDDYAASNRNDEKDRGKDKKHVAS